MRTARTTCPLWAMFVSPVDRDESVVPPVRITKNGSSNTPPRELPPLLPLRPTLEVCQ